MNPRSSARRASPLRARRGRPRLGQKTDRGLATTTLLEAAEDVAAARGVEATTIAAIAERAGVAVGTLYNYFPDRDAMFSSLFQMRREELVPRLDAAAREAQRLPYARRLRAYLSAAFGLFEERRKFLQVVMGLGPNSKLLHKKPAMLAAMTEALADIVRAVAPVDAEVYAHMIVGAMRALIHRRIEQGEPFAEDGDLLADTFLRGMEAR
jgi:AcrR family transcriptional regulator